MKLQQFVCKKKAVRLSNLKMESYEIVEGGKILWYLYEFQKQYWYCNTEFKIKNVTTTVILRKKKSLVECCLFFFILVMIEKKKGNPVSSYIISKQFFFLFVLSVHVVCRKRMDGRWGECKWATEEGRASGQKKIFWLVLDFFYCMRSWRFNFISYCPLPQQ